ncbi:hypothetical protein I8748_05480 [Nostoc sp. CENA67]|uniref:Uncharacterized protein n=1 Tax=Amazonocrinis nigriterrae CENA67 TaxID=2794033 RepID=A0A8J7L5V5_9NOST|nr:hypothetical protein [Amazonocrinis nigriterrae]MBH8561634.1 hypothetical protein [Amazonocrinis nigriterrae CENA67]
MPCNKAIRGFCMNRGGVTSTTWDSGSSWQSGKTKVIRVPEAIADEVMRCARLIDAGNAVLHGNTDDKIEIVLSAIAAYIEIRSCSRHANQHTTKKLDISARTWDEMRKFTAMVRHEPNKLGLNKNE